MLNITRIPAKTSAKRITYGRSSWNSMAAYSHGSILGRFDTNSVAGKIHLPCRHNSQHVRYADSVKGATQMITDSSSISGAELLSFTENSGRGAKYFSTTATTGDASTGTDAEGTKDESVTDTPEFAKATGLADVLKPKQVVAELEKYIIGQSDAKKAVANAIRNRWRRQQLEPEMRKEVTPKNILMVGPTGSGKTEIARRVATLGDAPFIKVEATKFTEVGFHGKDVDTIITDLVQASIKLTAEKRSARNAELIKEIVEQKIVDTIVGSDTSPGTKKNFLKQLREGYLENVKIDITIPPNSDGSPKMMLVVSGVGHPLAGGGNMHQHGGDKGETKKCTVKEAREILEQIEKDKLMNDDTLMSDAVTAVEESGIVFIDEIDKIAVNRMAMKSSADASSEGVQRDLLPLIEGTTVDAKIGDKTLQVKTEHILFICAGAFSQNKPSDLLAEFLGRLPIRVQLKPLTADDFYKIMTETKYPLPSQHKALLKTEGVDLQFTDEALHEMARCAALGNKIIENIGARRLHTVIEKVIEDISYDAAEEEPGTLILVDEKMVKERVGEELEKESDFSRFVM